MDAYLDVLRKWCGGEKEISKTIGFQAKITNGKQTLNLYWIS